MMKSIMLDEKNNIKIYGNIETVNGINSVIQDCKTRLSMTNLENPFNLEEGIDYLDYLQRQDTNGMLIQIMKRIREDKRITNLNIDMNKENGKLKINIETIYGNGEFEI